MATAWLRQLPTLHDVTADALPAAAFDLAHCRLVLAHLPQRQAVLADHRRVGPAPVASAAVALGGIS